MTSPASRARGPLLAAGLFGLTGVALGALGAHALAVRLTASSTLHAWETASRYQLFHAVALLGAALWVRGGTETAAKRMAWAARCWTVGILLFSGSLYGLALEGPRWLGPITPLGGVVLIAGWVCVIAAALAKTE